MSDEQIYETARAHANRIRSALRELNTALANGFKDGVRVELALPEKRYMSENMDGKVQVIESAPVIKLNDIWVEEKL